MDYQKTHLLIDSLRATVVIPNKDSKGDPFNSVIEQTIWTEAEIEQIKKEILNQLTTNPTNEQ